MSAGELFKKVCFDKSIKYTGVIGDERYKTSGKKICTLNTIPGSYLKSYISSGIQRGFKYKRSFDIGFMKLIFFIFYFLIKLIFFIKF